MHFMVFFANMICSHGYVFCLIIFMFHDFKAALALSLSRDTFKTIHGNEVYEAGYYISRHTKLKQCYYSASSSVGINRLAHDELKIYEALSSARKCIAAQDHSKLSPIVQEYLEDYEATSGVLIKTQRLEDVKNKAAAPAGDLIGAYRMVRRFRNYIQLYLFKALSSYNASLFCDPKSLATLKNFRPTTTKGPFKRDFQLTMFAIIFTHLQLGFKADDISKGSIKGMALGTSLQAVHCVEIGVHAVATRFFPVGIEWLQLAVTKIQNGDKTMDFNLASSLLQKSVAEHDEYWQPIAHRDLNEVFYKARLNASMENPDREWPSQFEANGQWFHDEVYTDKTWEVCRGKMRQTEAEKSKLFCWHETTVHPTWKLGPLKAELLARHPLEVLQFHQVLHDSEIKSIKSYHENRLLAPIFERGKEMLRPKVGLCEASYISSVGTHELTGRIAGLKARTAAMYPVISYPPGGHIRLHVDRTYGKDIKEHLATIVYFLDGPDVGGETAIPAAKVLVKPIKGSAILFYSLLKSARFDRNSKHASCAVVQGSKWIMNRWMDYDLQTQLKCDLDENSLMEYLVNGKSKYKDR